MKDLIRAYGWGLSAVFLLAIAVWAILLIVLPQLSMVEQSLRFQDRSDRLATVRTTIDNLHDKVSTLGYDLQQGQVCEEAPAAMHNPFASAAKSCRPLSTEERAGLEVHVAEMRDNLADLKSEETRLLEAKQAQFPYSLKNYTMMRPLHARALWETILSGVLVTLLALIACYPVAYVMALESGPKKAALLFLALIIPYAINELLRVYAWLTIFDREGVLNTLLDWLGIISFQAEEHIIFYREKISVFIVIVYTYILFMVFPIYNTMSTLDRNQLEAARDLGAGFLRIHRRIIIPHARPGIVVGSIMTFMLAVGTYSVPLIITRGLQPKWFTQLIYDKFYESQNWNQGAAYSFLLLALCMVFVFGLMKLFKVKLKELEQ